MLYAQCSIALFSLNPAIRIPCLREAASAKAGKFRNWNAQLFYG
jgi:hypothetical protein